MSSTNSVDHFTDANGTKLVAGAALDAAALDDIRKTQQPNSMPLPYSKPRHPPPSFVRPCLKAYREKIGQSPNYTPRPKQRGWRCNPALPIVTTLKPYYRKP